ncbi:MAG TPA: bifunctional folylpolyglutamate synthase/dihydrofolate synthase [Acholeplasmatales bacterium]|nr:bifunctional folylpolyglutamate synthase/dihydrofolate synthase [Acholeplasmatales bacterium]
MFTNFDDAVAWIENSRRFGEKTDLTRMRDCCRRLGDPQDSFKSIHVAGTNGKGSTANYLKNILHAAGYKTGVYTSPYVVKFNERIGIGDDFIPDATVVFYANFLHDLWDRYYAETGDSITFFEIVTLMCFLWFRDERITWGVIEVGLGGLFDATNVIVPEASCITNISYDHMKQLGNTLESIALNKLGIVKPYRPLITTEDKEQLIPLFKLHCHEKHAPYVFVDVTTATDVAIGEQTSFTWGGARFDLRLTGAHQIKNAALAIETIRVLCEKQAIVVSPRNLYDGLHRTTWPGRFEIFGHKIILDGAHNIGAFETLEPAVKAVFPGKYVKCFFCMMKDKDHKTVIALLDRFVDEFHFTTIDYHRAAPPEELMDESAHPKKFCHDDFLSAFAELSHLGDNEVLLVCGSLYFISEIRKLLVL